MQPFREIIKGELIFHFHPGQQRVFDSEKRFTAMLAGTQGGKTCIGSPWLHDKIQQMGEGDYLAVEATYDLFQAKMLPEMLWYFEQTLGIGRYWASTRTIELSENLEAGNFRAKKATDPMWGRIILRSAESEGGLESATAKAAWLDEAGMPEFSRRAWEAVQRRLSLSQGPVLFTTTLYDWGWFKSEIYDRWEKGDPDYDVVQFDSTMNPAFPRAEYERAKKTLPAWKFDLFYRGRYAKPAGLIYDSFNEAVCKISRKWDKPPKDWPVYVGHDFGPVHTSALWYAQDPATGFLYLYRTYLSLEKSTTKGHAEKWVQLSRDENIIKRVGGSHTEEGWREAFAIAGWPVSEPLINDVEIGIDRVYGWHKKDRLFVFNDLFDYIAEKQSYSRKLDINYNPTEEIKDKSLFHLMDGERYILSEFQPVDVVKTGQDIAAVQDVRPSHQSSITVSDNRFATIQSFRSRK